MNINTYIRLLQSEFDYHGVPKHQAKAFIQTLLQRYQDHLDQGQQPDLFFTKLGEPKGYARSLGLKPKAFQRGTWSIIGISMAVVFGITFNDLIITVIIAGAFVLIDLVTK